MQFHKQLTADFIGRSCNRFILRQLNRRKFYVRDNYVYLELFSGEVDDVLCFAFIPGTITPESIDNFIMHVNKILEGHT